MIKPIAATRIEASYTALSDPKGRRVSGYAIVTEYAASDVDRVVTEGDVTSRGPEQPFVVKTYATRDGQQFGASFPRGKIYPTREAAFAGAAKALAAQGKRYAKTFGGAS
jgi:hypothetical protein